MSRLTKYFADRDEYGHNSCHGGCESCTGVLCRDASEMIKKLAHYEDLEEQGRLIELPCKVGDTVYVVGTKCLEHKEPTEKWCETHDCYECIYDKEYTVFERIANEYTLYELVLSKCAFFKLNKNTFLTKEEAEAKLSELKGTEE